MHRLKYMKTTLLTALWIFCFTPSQYADNGFDMSSIIRTWDNGDEAFLRSGFDEAYYLYDDALQNLQSLNKKIKDNKSVFTKEILLKRMNLVEVWKELKAIEKIYKYAQELMVKERWNEALRQFHYIYERVRFHSHIDLIEDMKKVIAAGIENYLLEFLKKDIELRESELQKNRLPKNIYVYSFFTQNAQGLPGMTVSAIQDAIATYLQAYLGSSENENQPALLLRKINQVKNQISPEEFRQMRAEKIDMMITGRIMSAGSGVIRIEFSVVDVLTELPIVKVKLNGKSLEKIKNSMETLLKEITQIIKKFERNRYYRTIIYDIADAENIAQGEIQTRQLNCTPGVLITPQPMKTYSREIYLQFIQRHIDLCEKKLIYFENTLVFKGIGTAPDGKMKEILERFSFPAITLTYKFNFPYKKYFRVLFEVEFGYFRNDSSTDSVPFHSTVMHTFFFFANSTIKLPLDIKRRIFIYPRMGFGFLVHDTVFHKNVWNNPIPGVEPYNKSKVVVGAVKFGFEIHLGLNAIWGLVISYDFIWGTDKNNLHEVYHFPAFGFYIRM